MTVGGSLENRSSRDTLSRLFLPELRFSCIDLDKVSTARICHWFNFVGCMVCVSKSTAYLLDAFRESLCTKMIRDRITTGRSILLHLVKFMT